MASNNDPPRVPVPDYRPVERFWPYVDLPEQPSDEELAALDPELSEALFGTPPLPFSVTLEFPVVRRARLRARGRRWRARRPTTARSAPATAAPSRAVLSAGRRRACATLFELVGRFDATDVLIDDRPVPYARELWLPLMWFLIR